LLSLIMTHLSARASDGTAVSTLAFSVPLAPNPDAAPGGPVGLDQADVFVHLRLTALTGLPGEPVRRSPLLAPRFPSAAPEFAPAMAASVMPAGPRPLTVAPAAGP
jgi:hypothetical protein